MMVSDAGRRRGVRCKAKADRCERSRHAAQCSHVGEAPALPKERSCCLECLHLGEKHPISLQALILQLLLSRSRGMFESRQTLWSLQRDEQKTWFSALSVLKYFCGSCRCRVLRSSATSTSREWLLTPCLLDSPSP